MKQLEKYQIELFGEEQCLERKPHSVCSSPRKDFELEEQTRRQSSLCKKAKDLQGVGSIISSKIASIKGLIEG